MILLFHILQAIILLSSLICYFNSKNFKERALRYFSPFLIITFLVQYAGYYYSIISGKSNDWIFNLFAFIENGFFICFFYHVYFFNSNKKFLIAFCIIFLSWALINIALIQGLFFLNTYTHISASVLFVCLSCIYFYEILSAEEFIQIGKSGSFWIILSLFLYYLGNFILLVIFPIIFRNNPSQSIRIYWSLMTPLNIILYSLLSFGFYVEGRRL